MKTDLQPSPHLFFNTITGYQAAAALRAALDLDVFTLLANGPGTAQEIANQSKTALRGARILCDHLAVQGFLTKTGNRYALTPDSAVFLNRNSPAYLGGAVEFLLSDGLTSSFEALTESVRRGGTAASDRGTTEANHPIWLSFARAMGGMMVPAAEGLAQMLGLDPQKPTRILDVAAGHGMWGIAFAKKYPKALVVALDWAEVLQIAREHAQKAGVLDRFSTIAGSAFDVELGGDYDVVLVPNFLHHFNRNDCVRFLKRVHGALRAGGRVAIVEFVPNEDRVTPPAAAGFSLVMLATTPEGDAYTFAEYTQMLTAAGFQPPTAHSLPASMNQALISTR
ncbi:MAG: crtF [Verrucomicrobiales bacterium]|nr:crtF [Verrucomicrobiales bacterium]